MSALPLSAALPATFPAAPGLGGAAVLPPALLSILAGPVTAPLQGLQGMPTFDRTLQLLLAGNAAPLAAAAPLPGEVAGTEVDTETDTDTDTAASGSPLQFDPALTSLAPPAAVALAQASQVGVPATPVRPAPVAPAPITATAAAGAGSGRDTVLATLAMASTAATAATTAPAPALPVAPATPVPAAAQADAAPALPLDRAPGAATPTLLQVAAPAAVGTADNTTATRSSDTAPQGRAPSLLQQLGDRVAVQIERGSERVVIRLDPPHRGQIEIHIRQDASGATQVQLSASHGDVVRQLHAIGDSLRQDLAQRQGGEVSVQIAQHGRDADGRQRQERQGEQQQQQPGRALDEQAEAGRATDGARFALAADRA